MRELRNVICILRIRSKVRKSWKWRLSKVSGEKKKKVAKKDRKRRKIKVKRD